MLVNSAAENALGTLGISPLPHPAMRLTVTPQGAVCWTIQLLPQIWKTWREKSTEGLSPWLGCVFFILSYQKADKSYPSFIWGLTSIFLGVYAIVQKLSIALIVQPQLFGTLSLISWGQVRLFLLVSPIPLNVQFSVNIMTIIGLSSVQSLRWYPSSA